MSNPAGKIALFASILVAGASTELTGQTGGATGAATAAIVTSIPAGYQPPAGGWTPRCSADGSVCAVRAQQGAQTFVLINGKPGPGYEEIGSIIVSDDGKRVAYSAKRRGSWVVVADGKEGPEYQAIDRLTFFKGLPLYVGTRSGQVREEMDGVFRGTRRVQGFRQNGVEGTEPILDVVVGDKVDDITMNAEERRGAITDLTISPDGTSYAYILEERGSGGPSALWIMMLNGESFTEDHGLRIFGFTQDNRLVYTGRTGSFGEGRAKVILHDKMLSSHRGDIQVGAAALDGRHVAFIACAGGQPARRGQPREIGKCQLMLDDKPLREAPEDVLSHVNLSPDGTTLAFTEQQPGGQLRAIVGDRPGPLVNALQGGIVFSPDSKRHAYVAKVGTTQVVVLDGVAGPAFDNVEGVRFSADSKHVAYKSRKSGVEYVVLDQIAGRTGFDWVSAPRFDEAGTMAMFVALEGRNLSRGSVAVAR
jgi:hypothetical protein